jgi:hypothetical protein
MFQSDIQLARQNLLAFIFRKPERTETSAASRQCTRLRVTSLNDKNQALSSVHRHPTAGCNEFQQLFLLFLRIGFDHLPEPTNDRRCGRIMTVGGGFLQSVDIEMIVAFDQSPKLVGVQELDICEHSVDSVSQSRYLLSKV